MKRQGSRSLVFSGILTLVPVLGLTVGALRLLRSDQAEVEANAQRELASLSVRFAADVENRWARLVPSAAETMALMGNRSSETALPVESSTWRLDAMGDPVDVFFAPEIPVAPAWWVSLTRDQRDAYRRFVAARSGNSDERPPHHLPESARHSALFERLMANASVSNRTATMLRIRGPEFSRIVLPSGMSGNEVALWRGLQAETGAADPTSLLSGIHEYLMHEQPGSWSELDARLIEWERAVSETKGNAAAPKSLDERAKSLAGLRQLGAFRNLEREKLREFRREHPPQYWREGARIWNWKDQALCSLLLSKSELHTNEVGENSPTLWMLTSVPARVLQEAVRAAAGPLGEAVPVYARPRTRWVDSEWNRIAPWSDPRTNSTLSAYRPVRWGNEDQGFALAEVGFEVFDERLLLSGQRRRARTLGAFVIGAAVVSGLGFWQLRRAFLQQAQLAEQQSNFVASVSHELRAPVASLGLLVDNLRRGSITDVDRKQEYLRFMARECRRLSQLIQNVLATGRLDQGRWQYLQEPLDLLRLMKETVESFTPLARENAVELVLTVHPPNADGCFEMMGDALAVQQAVTNLLDNALKHSPVNTTIRVGLTRMEGHVPGASSKTLLRLTIDDSGPGVPEGERERIFDRFYRLGSELRRETVGVGLGLSLVRSVIEAHQGRVWCASNPDGVGSRFVVEVPLDPA